MSAQDNSKVEPSPLGPDVTNATTRKTGRGKAPIGTRPGHSKNVDAQMETLKIAKKAYENNVTTTDAPWAQVYYSRLINVADISTLLGNNIYNSLYSQVISSPTGQQEVQILEVIAGVDYDHASMNAPTLHKDASGWSGDSAGRNSLGKFSKFYTIVNDAQLPAVGSFIKVQWTDSVPRTTGLILEFGEGTGVTASNTMSAAASFNGGRVGNVGNLNLSHETLTPVNEEEHLTAHFKYKDFRCKDGTPVPEKFKGNIKILAAALEVLRKAIGEKPITITSGYRTKSYNDRLRIKDGKKPGIYTSQHLQAKAADIRVAGMTPEQIWKVIEKLIRGKKMTQGGIGVYDKFTHYDVRGTKARWGKAKQQKGSTFKASTEGSDNDTSAPIGTSSSTMPANLPPPGRKQ